MCRKRFIVNIKLLYGSLSGGGERRARGTWGSPRLPCLSLRDRESSQLATARASSQKSQAASVGACRPELSGFDMHHRYMPTEIHMPHSPEAREIREVALSGKKKLVSRVSEDL